jgi:hypothetical protein
LKAPLLAKSARNGAPGNTHLWYPPFENREGWGSLFVL